MFSGRLLTISCLIESGTSLAKELERTDYATMGRAIQRFQVRRRKDRGLAAIVAIRERRLPFAES